jgi:hypothetical protein
MGSTIYTKPPLNTEYDSVVVIDFLPPEHRAKWRITEELTKLLASAGIPSYKVECANYQGALEAFARLRSMAEKGEKFCVHVVAHGNEQELGVGPTDRLEWDEFGALLVPINFAASGNLLVNMTSCKGLHGVKSVSPGGNADDPFYLLFGVKHDLDVDDAVALNSTFYGHWSTSGSIAAALAEVEKQFGLDFLFVVSSEGYRKIRALNRRNPKLP